MLKYDIEELSKSELIELKGLVVEKLKMMHEVELLEASRNFHFCDYVCFEHNGKKHSGVVIRINKKTITIISAEERKFKVSPTLLKKEKKPSKKLVKFKKSIVPDFYDQYDCIE